MQNPFRRSPTLWDAAHPPTEERSTNLGDWFGSPSDPSFAMVVPHGYGLSNNAAGLVINYQTVTQINTVFACLRILNSAIQGLGWPRGFSWEFYDGDWYRDVPQIQPPLLTSPFQPLFHYDGMARTLYSLAIFGEAWWYITSRDDLGYAQSLEVLNPALIDVEIKQGKRVVWYGIGGQRIQLNDPDFVHIPFIASPGALRGLAMSNTGGDVLALAKATVTYGNAFFGQGASPSYILSTEQSMTQDDVDALAERFMKKGGLAHAHLPLVADNGLQVQKTQATPDESQFIATAQFAINEVAALMGVPSYLLGQGEGRQAAATAQEMSSQLVAWTLRGYITPMEQAFSSLLPGDQCVYLDDKALLAPSSKDLGALLTGLNNSRAVSGNDLRVKFLNLPPKLDDPQANLIGTALPSNVSGDAQEAQQNNADDSDGADGDSKNPPDTAGNE